MNSLRITFLLLLLSLVFVSVGYMLGGRNGMVIAFVFAVIFNFASYWFSDKIALALYLELLNKNELRGMFAGNSRNERGGGNAFGT